MRASPRRRWEIAPRPPRRRSCSRARGLAERLGPLPDCDAHAAGGAARADEAELPPLRKERERGRRGFLLFTSGTTGKAERRLLTHRKLRLACGEDRRPLRSARRRRRAQRPSSAPYLRVQLWFAGPPDARSGDHLSGRADGGSGCRTRSTPGASMPMIGVPALWQLLHRRLTQSWPPPARGGGGDARPRWPLHGELRIGPPSTSASSSSGPSTIASAASCGCSSPGESTLPEEVQRAFHELGFDSD